MPKNFIIDADIAHSAGLSIKPISKQSREVLQTILDSKHKVLFCKELRQEWKKHSSLFSAKWLSSMTARKLVCYVTPVEQTEEKIESSELTDKQIAAALKDKHIINIALSVESLIASNDTTARKIYHLISLKHRNLRNLVWACPRDNCDTLLEFIKDGKKVDPSWLLQHSEA